MDAALDLLLVERRIRRALVFPVVLVTACLFRSITTPSAALAFEDQVHRLVNQRAAEVARIGATSMPIDQMFKASLGMIFGLGTPFPDADQTTNEVGEINTAVTGSASVAWLRIARPAGQPAIFTIRFNLGQRRA